MNEATDQASISLYKKMQEELSNPRIFNDPQELRQVLEKYSLSDIEGMLAFSEKSFPGNYSSYYAASYLAEKKGKYHIKGNGAYGLGIYLKKGILTIEGNVGLTTGYLMEDGEVVIKGSAEGLTGAGMKGGEIIIFGNTGKMTGNGMKGGIIICFGKVENVDSTMEGGMIYANEFGEVPENARKCTRFIDEIFKDCEESEKLKEVLKNYKKLLVPFANNKKKCIVYGKILGISPEEVALEYENSRSGMW